MKIIDLSKPIKYNKSDPWFMRVKIKHKPHKKAKWILRAFGLPRRLYPKGFDGWADDTIKKWACTPQLILMPLGTILLLQMAKNQKQLMKFH